MQKLPSLFILDRNEYSGMTETPFNKEIMDATGELNQLPQKKTEIEIGFYQQRYCQFEKKKHKSGTQNETWPWKFWDITGMSHR